MDHIKNKSHKNAFTLIELLIVIVIIGILAGVVLAVVNPAQLIARSNQGSARAVVAKACLAYGGCMSSTNDATRCDVVGESGIRFPTSNTYGGAFNIDTNGLPSWTGGTCTLTCDRSGASGVALSGTCLITPL